MERTSNGSKMELLRFFRQVFMNGLSQILRQPLLEEFTKSHDRFLIIDDTVYHIGASLKDLGKKWFAFCKMGIAASVVLGRIV